MASISRMTSSVSWNESKISARIFRQVRFSHHGQFSPGFVGAVDLTGGDLFQSLVDLFIKSATFFVRPVLFSIQSFQSAAYYVLSIGEGAAGQPFLH